MNDATLLQFGDNPFASVLYGAELKIYRKDPRAQIPTWATEGAACFDLKACFTEKSEIQVWSNHSKKKILEPYGADYKHTNDNRTYFILEPGYRAMIPTGLIFDIPSGYSLRAHPRSGLAIKQGLTLINSMAIVDEDFINETMVLLVNTSSELCEIHDGDRIAQAELVRQLQYTMTETNDAPQQKTSRIDGFGSTGI